MWPFRSQAVPKTCEDETEDQGETRWIGGAPLPQVWVYWIYQVGGGPRMVETLGYTADVEVAKKYVSTEGAHIRAALAQMYQLPDGRFCHNQPVTAVKTLT